MFLCMYVRFGRLTRVEIGDNLGNLSAKHNVQHVRYNA